MAVAINNAVPATTANDTDDDVWVSIARGYAEFSSPMVPSEQDIGLYEQVAACHAVSVGKDRINALMLGVTPGIAQMRWPEGARVLAVEVSPEVIRALWPGDIPHVREARCASWFEMSMGPGSCDLIVGDGSLNTCRFPGELQELSRLLSKLLTHDGVLAVRCYVQQGCSESVESVFDALFNSRVLNVDSFKMRLYLAMQKSPLEGVSVRDAARVLDSFGVDSRLMKQFLGWSDAAIEPFLRWRTSDAVYSFPSLDELRTALSEDFDEVSVTLPTYELGHCCPMLVMRTKGLKSAPRGL